MFVAVLGTIAIVVVALVLGGGGLVAYWMIAHERKDRRVRAEGRPLLVSLMMANHGLYEHDGDPELPGAVVFGFYEATPQLRTTLRAIAQRCYDLYTADQTAPLTPVSRAFSQLLKNHNYHEDRRNRVPAEVAGEPQVFVADLWIRRDRLPDGWHEHKTLACTVSGADQGSIAMLPLDDHAAQSLYRAAGLSIPLPPVDPASVRR